MTGDPGVRFCAARVDQGDGARLEAAMRAEVEALYPGLDMTAAGMPKAGPDELHPPSGQFLVGYLDGVAVCCGGFKTLALGVCEIKRMYVIREARGRSLSRALLGELERRARAAGFHIARLDTGPHQPAAWHVYASSGYRPIENFNASPVATLFGEKRLGEPPASTPPAQAPTGSDGVDGRHE